MYERFNKFSMQLNCSSGQCEVINSYTSDPDKILQLWQMFYPCGGVS